MPRRCSICSNPKKSDWVARRHLEGYTPTRMEGLSKEAGPGMGMKRETMQKHLRVCIGTEATGPDVVRVTDEVVKASAEGLPPYSSHGKNRDVATLVQAQVVEKLEEGEARVTVQHGLQAQQLLDRRAERAKDRELAVTLARLLHSPAPPPEAITARLVDAEVIEGEAVEV